jgi:hypothetical protein
MRRNFESILSTATRVPGITRLFPLIFQRRCIFGTRLVNEFSYRTGDSYAALSYDTISFSSLAGC